MTGYACLLLKMNDFLSNEVIKVNIKMNDVDFLNKIKYKPEVSAVIDWLKKVIYIKLITTVLVWFARFPKAVDWHTVRCIDSNHLMGFNSYFLDFILSGGGSRDSSEDASADRENY